MPKPAPERTAHADFGVRQPTTGQAKAWTEFWRRMIGDQRKSPSVPSTRAAVEGYRDDYRGKY